MNWGSVPASDTHGLRYRGAFPYFPVFRCVVMAVTSHSNQASKALLMENVLWRTSLDNISQKERAFITIGLK